MKFTWSRKRIILLIIACVSLMTGYMLMFYNDTQMVKLNEEIFNFRRITLAPVFVLVGYAVIAIAIMIKSENKQVQ